MSKVKLSLIVPVYNEAEAIPIFVSTVTQVLKARPDVEAEFVFVNDGSQDGTLELVVGMRRHDSRITVVDLSRNFGKESAMTAGLKVAKGDIVIPIDVDLQDPPDLIPEMISRWEQGDEVVVAKRINRDEDTWFKRQTALLFYRLHNRISKTKIPENVGDFRLMDRRVVETLNSLPESCRFNRGLFAWAGYRTSEIEFERPVRSAGKSKFNTAKMMGYAIEAITSFSTAPLRIWTYLGACVSLASLCFAAYIVLRVFCFGVHVPGWASIIVAVTFLGGLNLIGIGILGEYLGRTYLESKQRPSFVIREIHQGVD